MSDTKNKSIVVTTPIKVHTVDSVYRVELVNVAGERVYQVTKIEDLRPCGHPYIKLGVSVRGKKLFLEIGKPMQLMDSLSVDCLRARENVVVAEVAEPHH